MLLAPALIASAASADDVTARRSITISANGTVTAVPDLARITSGVATEAPVARDAVAKNSAAMQKVIAGLKAAASTPRTSRPRRSASSRATRGRVEGEAPKIDGYRVHQPSAGHSCAISTNWARCSTVWSALGANEMAGLPSKSAKPRS